MKRILCLFSAVACVALVGDALGDWRQFRGAGGAGLTTETNLPTSWGDGQNVKWSVTVPGEGWASPIIVGDNVYVATAVSDGEKGRDSNTSWELHCYDSATGKEKWKKVAATGKPRIGTHGDNTYASETPATDGEHIVVYFGMTGVYCYDLEGEQLWEKDLGAFNMQNDWGTSSSPVIHDGLVYVQVDNEQESFLVALDVTTGDEKWRKERDEKSNWGSVVVWENSQRTEIVTLGAKARSYDPKSGDLLWEAQVGGSGASSTPAATKDLLLLGHAGFGGGGGLLAIKPGGSGDLTGGDFIAWKNEKAAPRRSSPLMYEGYVYILADRGAMVSVLDAKTGETVHEERMGGGAFWASPYGFEGKVFCPADNGTTYVLKAGPDFEQQGENKLEGRFWSTPSISGGSIFIRSVDKLFCIAK